MPRVAAFVHGVFAATLFVVTSTTAAEINADNLRTHVEALTSDKMEGRLTGTMGERAATDYVASRFQAIGLLPAGPDGFFQPFGFSAGVSLNEGNALTLDFAGKLLSSKLGSDWRPLAFSRTGAVPAAKVVFAGYGIVATEAPEYNSYEGVDANGQWVLIWRGVPVDAPAEMRVHLSRYADLHYKASIAKSRGAVGIIVSPAPGVDYADDLPAPRFDASIGLSDLPAIAVNRAMGQRMLDVLGPALDKAMELVRKSERTFGGSLSGISASAMIALSLDRRTGRNVVGLLDLGAPPGTAPIVIGAHVDHLGRGETSGSLARSDERQDIHHGADDNASGVAALIEIADFLTKLRSAGELAANRNILFAAWSGEELGLLGSRSFLDGSVRAGKARPYAGYLNMDMIGRLRQRVAVAGMGSSSDWPRIVAVANANSGLTLEAVQSPYVPTDAMSFYLAGIPVLSVSTGAHSEYHTPRDSAETLDYGGIEGIATFVAHLARELAVTPSPPVHLARAAPEKDSVRRRANVTLGTIPDYAAEARRGVPISDAIQNGPADRAGLTAGDSIVGLAGVEIANIYDFVRVLNELKPNEAIDIDVERGGERLSLQITPFARVDR